MIMEADKYVFEYLQNPYDLEKEEILESLEIFNPYSGDYEEPEEELDEDEMAEMAFLAAIEKSLQQKSLDVGLAKGIIRRARAMHSPVLIFPILDNFKFFLPVVSDAMIYISQIISEGSVSHIQGYIETICASESMNNPLARYWIEWFVAHHAQLLSGVNAQQMINTSTNIENQAIAAVTGKNIAWVRHMKAQIYNMSARGRRAVLYSTRILPSDERTHWLKMTIGSTQFLIDKWVAVWVLETA